MTNRHVRYALPGMAVALCAWIVAGASPRSPAATSVESNGECGFSIRASNNISHDVWLYFYDSEVKTWGFGVLSNTRQLKIQNVRIPPGKTMTPVNYSANGNCNQTRDWRFQFKRGTAVMSMQSIRTKGDNTSARTIDLGPASSWKRAD